MTPPRVTIEADNSRHDCTHLVIPITNTSITAGEVVNTLHDN